MHDATKVLLGTTTKDQRVIDNVPGAIAAGLAVRAKSDGTYTVAHADGATIGVSVGVSLSGHSRTAVCREGLGVAIQLTSAFTPTVGAQVAISDTTGKAIGYTGTGDRYFNASYASSTLTGIAEDGSEVNVALIDFPGGL